MKSIDRRELEEEMYDVANKIVGNVGPNIDSNFVFNMHTKDKPRVSSDAPCDIASFRLRRKILDHSEIMNMWTKWITAYRDFKKLHRPPYSLGLDDNPDLIIRWLQRPIINDENEFQYKNEEDKSIRIKAFLIIHRIDCYPVEPEWKARVSEGETPCLTMEILNKAVALQKSLKNET